MKILVTGAAGFIGMHSVLRLLELGYEVIGLDNLNDYYDVNLKIARLELLKKNNRFSFKLINITDAKKMDRLFAVEKPIRVLHLAAQAGVRYSLANPSAFIDSNITGFMNILECCRDHKIKHLVYASSSSVYGGNETLPFSEGQNVDHPVSLYAASKKTNELMAHAYSHLFNIPTTGLRFFTVYGPWGRPDMALFLFADAMIGNKPINIFNQGKMIRDFTYIDDIVEGVVRVLDKTATPDTEACLVEKKQKNTAAPYRIFNIGNGKPTNLMDYIHALEAGLGMKAKKNFLPMQLGEVKVTSSDTSALKKWVGFQPQTSVMIGVQKFADWYLKYNSIR